MVQLQQTFYIIAIIYMIIQIIFWLGIGVIMFAVYKKISELSDNVGKKIDSVQEALSHPGDIAAQAGASIMQSLMQKFSRSFRH